MYVFTHGLVVYMKFWSCTDSIGSRERASSKIFSYIVHRLMFLLRDLIAQTLV